jgi:hypothetical protein
MFTRRIGLKGAIVLRISFPNRIRPTVARKKYRYDGQISLAPYLLE